jgi:putative transposase
MYIQTGKPTQDAYVERFIRTVRHEWLDLYLFEIIIQAQALATQWLLIHNDEHHKDALGGIVPAISFQRAM